VKEDGISLKVTLALGLAHYFNCIYPFFKLNKYWSYTWRFHPGKRSSISLYLISKFQKQESSLMLRNKNPVRSLSYNQ